MTQNPDLGVADGTDWVGMSESMDKGDSCICYHLLMILTVKLENPVALKVLAVSPPPPKKADMSYYMVQCP